VTTMSWTVSSPFAVVCILTTLRAEQLPSRAAAGDLFVEEVLHNQTIDLVQSDTDPVGHTLLHTDRRTAFPLVQRWKSAKSINRSQS
jgi:hypothetical protein